MPGWTFEEARFVEEVLKPVKDGWSPSEDYFRTYLLPEVVSDPATIEAALAGLERELRKPALASRWPAPVKRIRSGHDAARAVLTVEKARKAHLAVIDQRREQLQRSLEDRLAGSPGLPRQVISSVATGSRGRHTRAEIRRVLAELGASERDPEELPEVRPPAQWGQLTSLLGSIGQDSLWQYLGSAPELNGPATTKAQLDARGRAGKVRRNDQTEAEASLLAILASFTARPQGLQDALRMELLTDLGDAAQYRFSEVLDIARRATDRLGPLGLPARPEAVAYAVWCRRRYADADPGSGWRTTLREALAARDLPGAVAALDSAPKLTTDEQNQRKRLVARIAELQQDLARAAHQEETDVEAAAAAYLRIGAEVADPAVAAGLARCVPAPVPRVDALITAGRVGLSWERSTARAGHITYTVVRASGRPPAGPTDGTVVVTDATATTASDERPPSAEHLHYAVFTVREGTPSRPAVAAPVLILGEVTDLVLEPAADAVSARWLLPKGASGVLVTRTGVAGGAGTDLRANPQGFTDRSAQVGERYSYLVRARFTLSGGSVVTNDGVRIEGECQEMPTPVPDLTVRLDGDELDLSWSPPARGDVQVREVLGTPPQPGLVALSLLADIGRPLEGVSVRHRGGLHARPAAGTGRMVLVAVTVLGDLAVVGSVAEVDRKLRPVRDLRAVRRSDEVTLTWIWPDGVNEVRVAGGSRRPTEPTDPSMDWRHVSRASYDAVGVRLVLPEDHSVLAVCTVSTDGGRTVHGPLTVVTAEGVREIPYRVERARRKRRRLTVGTPEGAALPATVLVARSRLRAMARQDGVEVLRLDGGEPQQVCEFELPPLGRPVHLRLFSLDAAAVTVPVRPDQLIVT